MRLRGCIRIPLVALTAGLAVHAFQPACRGVGANKHVPPEQQKRFEAMQAKGADVSLTIFPVILWDIKEAKRVGEMGKNVANVVALLLEKAGMDNLEAADAAYLLPADVEFDQMAGRFGEFLRAHPIKTDYALYAEFVGRTNPPRIDELRSVIVDTAGASVWVDRQTPDDADFKRMKPGSPMECCVLLAQRVRGLLGLPETANKDTGEGKFARLWARKSGLPDKAELSAMEQRQAAMKKAARTAKVAVFPVRLSGDEVSKEGAAHLASLLRERDLCKARALDTPLRIPVQQSSNEQKTLWDLARRFRDSVKQNPPDADYALYADYIGRVLAVHFVVCDRDGQLVIVDFQNNQHGDFQSMDPKTSDDCGRLVAKRLEGYLR